jgi:hypothetical protein
MHLTIQITKLARKETIMHYKTIVLELLQNRPELHEKLRLSRTLLTTLNLYSSHLKANHEAWMDRISRAKPGSERSQLASEALEIAVKEMEESMGTSDFHLEAETLSLDGVMAFTLGPKPRG